MKANLNINASQGFGGSLRLEIEDKRRNIAPLFAVNCLAIQRSFLPRNVKYKIFQARRIVKLINITIRFHHSAKTAQSRIAMHVRLVKINVYHARKASIYDKVTSNVYLKLLAPVMILKFMSKTEVIQEISMIKMVVYKSHFMTYEMRSDMGNKNQLRFRKK